jgi:predicted glycogen debranching enzyme
MSPQEALATNLNQFIVQRGNLKSIIAGYPWFLDWGRDSLIFVRGMVAGGYKKEARSVLKLFGQFEKDGTIPNMIHGKNAGNRDTSDAPLWFFVSCEDLVTDDDSKEFLEEVWGERTIRDILLSIARALMNGTPNGIRMDPTSGLLFSPAHFTWMDTSYPAGSPREGYPIEIQALWYRALKFLSQIDTENLNQWLEYAQQVRSSITDLFFITEKGYYSDCLHATPGTSASAAHPDDALRPNQLLVLTLGALEDETIAASVLSACEELLVPGAIRSLADREVAYPLPVIHNGQPINNPLFPYKGRYKGDEDTRRKPAYHNGTAWTWLFPSYSEAWFGLYGEPGRKTALAWLGSGVELINRGCIGYVPEILDGDYPHTQRGCDAQAWGVSELLRVWTLLTSDRPIKL